MEYLAPGSSPWNWIYAFGNKENGMEKNAYKFHYDYKVRFEIVL
jgi:hypothetical protein